MVVRVTDLAAAGVAETARMTAAGEATARAVVEQALERIERLDPDLNAFSRVLAAEALEHSGVPTDLASRVAGLPPAYMLLGIIEVANREGLDPSTVARVHFALG